MLSLFSNQKPNSDPGEDELLPLGQAVHEAKAMLEKAKAEKDELLARMLEQEDRGHDVTDLRKAIEECEGRVKHREDRLKAAIEAEIDREIDRLPETQAEYKTAIQQQMDAAGRALGELLFYCRSLGLASEADGLRAAFFGPHGTPRNTIAGQIWGSKGRFKAYFELPSLWGQKQKIALLDRLRRMPYNKSNEIKRRFGAVLRRTEGER
ncbi:MAG: hypothetical protein JRI83_07535 [Deltaproteobacteria bacterium]|nr:hypothetical protein [Deltaproteobacteria bacterium]